MMACISTKAFYRCGAIFAACLLAGCGEIVFDAAQAGGMIQGASIQLNGEPVLVTPEQVACAERADLLIVLPMGGRSVGQFNDAGRALGFSDDIHIGDPDYPMPYTQVRGKFTLYPSNVILTDVDENTKMAEAQTRVRIDHKCFEQPPPRLMGVYKGRFSATQNPSFSFRRRGDWWEFVSLKH